MYHLAAALPAVRRVRIPLSRDQLVLLIAAINELILGLDVLLAHNISGTIVPREWIPIIFGFIAGAILLIAGLIALRNRRMATIMASVVFLSSMVVGLLGSYFHFVRAILPYAPAGERIAIDLFIFAPPILGPLAFAGVGLLGLSAAWLEKPADSGTLQLGGGRKLKLPYSKTRAYLFIVSLGILAALISSVLDHARGGFDNPWFWLPTLVATFATVVSFGLGWLDQEQRTRNDIWVYIVAMLLMAVVGLIGALLHVQTSLTSDFQFVAERFLRGAPFLAPLQFANLAMLGLVVLLDPQEEQE
ncbi:MAG: hypothetical protein DWQ07_15800 [Chloroflexi bacterium]|nr:MAG: hypothetical protein DWQ07_15800 [Chloroflexota bacterium]MBL1195214.1 hypothetical protein [Chloroflexota bacterium]NOH12499.1 hypothetical protein [Chloroflexota bacterium]